MKVFFIILVLILSIPFLGPIGVLIGAATFIAHLFLEGP